MDVEVGVVQVVGGLVGALDLDKLTPQFAVRRRADAQPEVEVACDGRDDIVLQSTVGAVGVPVGEGRVVEGGGF